MQRFLHQTLSVQSSLARVMIRLAGIVLRTPGRSDDPLPRWVSCDPGQTLEKQQRVNRMREVVAQLKPRYRRLVELRYFEEYSYDEISKELNLPLGTVKAQLFRARDILAGVLEIDREHF